MYTPLLIFTTTVASIINVNTLKNSFKAPLYRAKYINLTTYGH